MVQNFEIKCFNCGKGYKSNNCDSKSKGTKCFNCEKFGHIVSVFKPKMSLSSL